MTTPDLVADYLIIFTKSAITKLELNKNESLRNSLTNVCINFRHYSAQYATKVLFTLFYGQRVAREEVLKKLFKNSHHFSIEFEESIQVIPKFDEEGYQALANELLYQYSAAHPGFLEVKTDCLEYQKELNSLKYCMSEHPVLLFRAVEMCKVVCHVETIVSRCVARLLSKSIVCRGIGLEMIEPNFQHRVLLLPFAREIGLLLQAMHNAKEDSNLSPFSIWLNQHGDNQSIPKELPQYLLLDEFKNFLNNDSKLISSLPNSADLGDCLTLFKENLNVLLGKEEFLHLTKAIVSLYNAKRSYREVQEDFSMGDEETLLAFSRSVNNLKEATEFYNCKLTDFIESCNS